MDSALKAGNQTLKESRKDVVEMLEQNLPLQYQLKQIFLEKIKKQEWKQGEKIPSEREICAQYQVSRITVREVLKDLEREGYFSRKQGKGTFVTLPKYVQKLNKFYSFREDMRKEGLKPSTTVLEFEEISCDNWLAGETGAAPGDKFFYITRLLMGGEEIYGYEISYIPADIVGAMSKEEIQENGLYHTIFLRSGLVGDDATEIFEAVNCPQNIALHLGIRKNDAIMKITRHTRAQGRFIEYCVSMMRGDRYRYHVNLNK